MKQAAVSYICRVYLIFTLSILDSPDFVHAEGHINQQPWNVQISMQGTSVLMVENEEEENKRMGRRIRKHRVRKIQM